jgi:hypothetical protein
MLSPAAQQIESLLDSSELTPLDDFLRQESQRQIEATHCSPSHYDVFAVRRNPQLGEEIFGPKRLHIGNYSEETLYGAAGSPVARFRSAIRALKARADKVRSVDPEQVEYAHQSTLLWAEVGRLKEFIGASPVISEVVAEFRTARFQFLGKDTPPAAVHAMASALRLVAEAKRLDTMLVDRVVEVLEEGGIDSLAPDCLRNSRG